MRLTLTLVACCWFLSSSAPGSPSSSSALASPSSGGFWMKAMTIRHVTSAARRHGLPLTALVAVWERECSLSAVCPVEKSIDPYARGPFQITGAAAARHGCLSGWQAGAGNADCAARILADWRRATGTWALAFTAYHKPEHLRDFRRKPSWYGSGTYRLMLNREITR